MVDELTVLTELGEDAELLLAPDEWLENERVSIQQRMSMLAGELQSILSAQRLKSQLQQRNLVAVRCVEKTDDAPSDIIIKICPLGDAINRLEIEHNDKTIPRDVSAANLRQQMQVWRSDGYDVATSKRNARRRLNRN